MFKNAIYATLSAPSRTTLRFVGHTRIWAANCGELVRKIPRSRPEGHTKGHSIIWPKRVCASELQDRIIVSWMKIGYTKEARLILQSEIYIFCYTTKLESKKQTVRQTTKKINGKLWNHCWNRHKYCKVQYYDTIFSFTPSPHLGMCYWKFNRIVMNRQIQGDILAGNQLLCNGCFK